MPGIGDLGIFVECDAVTGSGYFCGRSTGKWRLETGKCAPEQQDSALLTFRFFRLEKKRESPEVSTEVSKLGF